MKKENELDTTVDEWREALEMSVVDNDPSWKTATEIADSLGVNRTSVTRRLRKLIKSGNCLQGKCRRLDGTGRPQFLPAYKMVKKGVKR
jgi:predicted ArsR family transcriptional regulator